MRPFILFLFDLIIDALCPILERGKKEGHIHGLDLVLPNDTQCTHFLYADDTIFF
jgi:hypothetical protein